MHVEGAPRVPDGFFDYCDEGGIAVLGICYGMQVGGPGAQRRGRGGWWGGLGACGTSELGRGGGSRQLGTAQAPIRPAAPPPRTQLVVHTLGGEVKEATEGGEYGRMPMQVRVEGARARARTRRGQAAGQPCPALPHPPHTHTNTHTHTHLTHTLLLLQVVRDSALFATEEQDSQLVWMSHGDEAVRLPDGFSVVARSEQVRRGYVGGRVDGWVGGGGGQGEQGGLGRRERAPSRAWHSLPPPPTHNPHTQHRARSWRLRTRCAASLGCSTTQRWCTRSGGARPSATSCLTSQRRAQRGRGVGAVLLPASPARPPAAIVCWAAVPRGRPGVPLPHNKHAHALAHN